MILLLLALLPSVFIAQHNALTPEEQRDGWVLLFDGKTMKNWVDPASKTPPGNAWNITPEGELHTISHPSITEDLFTAATYRDFELSFEWRISPAGNSGVKYRIQDHRFLLDQIKGEPFTATVERTMLEVLVPRKAEGQDYVIGLEYQITDNAANRDALTAGPKHSTGALYDMVAPVNASPKPLADFNSSRIIVKGDHVEHWLNGVKVVDSSLKSKDVLGGIKKRWGDSPMVYALLVKQLKKDCPISLQNHGDEAWFRNIKVKRLNK